MGSLKKLQLDKLPPEKQRKARQVCQYLFCLVLEAFNSYGKKDLDGKCIKLFQEVLLSIGFPRTAEDIFNKWVSYQPSEQAGAAAEAAGAAEKGKDEKKKGKDG